MKISPAFLFRLAAVMAFFAGRLSLSRDPDASFPIWPPDITPPGLSRGQGEEKIVPERPRPFYQLTDITRPSVQVFRAPESTRNGTAVLVCPGGGLQRLAYEHEGLEVADWLNSKGITAFVLKYRVPAPAQTGLIDAQRAMGLIRSDAARWRVDAASLGILGFSAGGELAAWLVTHFEERAYPGIDAADRTSCRPDFAGLIYPGGLLKGRGLELKDEIAGRITTKAPPMFFAHAFDDGYENSLAMVSALKKAKVPTELHLFQDGGHGFGVRSTGSPVDDWRNRFAEWLGYQGFLDARRVREFAAEFVAALAGKREPPLFARLHPDSTEAEAYAVQSRVVRLQLGETTISGFKGAGASAAAQKMLGIDAPLVGLLFARGEKRVEGPELVPLRPGEPIVVETEIGYIIGVDISYEVLTDRQAKDSVEAIAPVIELPRVVNPDQNPPLPRNLIAGNIGSDRYLVGTRMKPSDLDPDGWEITLRRDGELLHQAKGGIANGGQWKNLRSIMNRATAQGHTIRAGSLIICGALGPVQPGRPGRYEAHYGTQQTLVFELK